MDSSNEPSSLSLSTSKSRKRKADNSKNVIVPSKRARFLSTYRRDQEWSLPESIIHYMAMNPKKADVYEKLIESCKYFFVQNPIIVAERFAYVEYNDLEGIPFLYKDQENILLPTVLSKFWITKEFMNFIFESSPNIVSSILSKFYRVNVKKLNLYLQNISFNDFLFLSANVEEIFLGHTVVKNEDGSIVPFEKLIKHLPHVTNVAVLNKSESSCITTNTVKELLELPHFSKIINFKLLSIDELFDIETFFAYMKKNQSTKFDLYFNPVSEAFKNRLEQMVDEIIKTNIRCTCITFIGLNRVKESKICSLFDNSR